MWERYGFYVVQTLLALYLAIHFKWEDREVYTLVGSFTALTYLSPVIGGWIADHLLGQKRTIVVGACVLLISYLCVTFWITHTGLTASLAGIAMGTGLLKPNISSLLGNEYPPGCANRESGFTIFYMGITSGIILGTTVPTQLHYYFGWSVSFLSAAFGMLIAIAVFIFGVHRYRIQDYNPYQHRVKNLLLALLMMSFMWISAFYIMQFPALADLVFMLVVLGSIGYVLYCIKYESPVQAKQTTVIVLLCLISVIFWAFYFQMFLSLTLFIARVVNPTVGGILFPPLIMSPFKALACYSLGCFWPDEEAK